VALRYRDVKYYQVWNEFKGMWNTANNNWDYVAYTSLYNQVYDALKSVDPTIQVGGPYLVLSGTGSASLLGKTGFDTDNPIQSRDNTTLDYWLANKHGADFLAVDRGTKDYHDANNYTEAELLQLEVWWGRVNQALRAKTTLPIWWAEDYSGGAVTGDEAFQAVSQATMLSQQALTGATMSLRWQPQADGLTATEEALFSNTLVAGGGKPFASYAVYQAFRDNFGPGTALVRTASSAADVQALASARKTLLINQRSSAITVSVNGVSVDLARYQVLLIDTPSGAGTALTATPTTTATATATSAASATATRTLASTATSGLPTQTTTILPTQSPTPSSAPPTRCRPKKC
jgi:hypothetical protein